MTTATAESFAGIVSQRVEAERHALAASWLRQLNELLTVDANDVFPSEQLLDHIPTLIERSRCTCALRQTRKSPPTRS